MDSTIVSRCNLFLLKEIDGAVIFQDDTNFNPEYGFAPLHIASANIYDNVQIINELIQKGSDLNCLDTRGRTALHNAVLEKNVKIVSCLLQNGANPNTPDNSFNTPLHWASMSYKSDRGSNEYHKEIKIVQNLLNFADVNAVNDKGETPLILASYKNLGIVNQLLRKSANVNVQDYKGRAALHAACINGNEEIVKMLLFFNADVNLLAKNKNTPLHCAVLSRDSNKSVESYLKELNIVKMLLSKSPLIDVKNKNGETPLMVAVKGLNLEVLKLLLKAGAHVNLTNKLGQNSLLILLGTTFNKKTVMIKHLIESGALITTVDKNGKNCIDYVKYSNIRKPKIEKNLETFVKIITLSSYPNVAQLIIPPELNAFKKRCFEELERLFDTKVDFNMADFLMVKEVNKANEILFKIMLTDEIRIFKEELLLKIDRTFLKEQLKIATNKVRNQCLSSVLFLTCEFLPNADIIHLYKACIDM